MSGSVWISLISLFLSLFALVLNVRKEFPKIRLVLHRNNEQTDCVEIVNAGNFSVMISSIGYISGSGKITWLEQVQKGKKDIIDSFPIAIFRGSRYLATITGQQFTTGAKFSYCVQLDCGRTYGVYDSLSPEIASKLKRQCIVSRLTLGAYGFESNNIHIS